MKPIDICNKYAGLFQELNAKLDISNDGFVRTTSPEHKKTVHWLWNKAKAAGDIFTDHYEGYYNVREETFVPQNEAEMTDFKDPTTGTPLEKRSEESYFFRMSKYQQRLLDHIAANPGFIQPENRKNEILARLKEPLRDRKKTKNIKHSGDLSKETIING